MYEWISRNKISRNIIYITHGCHIGKSCQGTSYRLQDPCTVFSIFVESNFDAHDLSPLHFLHGLRFAGKIRELSVVNVNISIYSLHAAPSPEFRHIRLKRISRLPIIVRIIVLPQIFNILFFPSHAAPSPDIRNYVVVLFSSLLMIWSSFHDLVRRDVCDEGQYFYH